MEAKFKIDDAIKFTNSVENKYQVGDEGRIDDDGIFERNGKYFYNVKSAGQLVTDVPEEDMDFVYSSVDRNVDEYLRKRESQKSFKDSDVRVSGSRKEMMAYSGLINSEDLQNIEKDKVIAKKLVKKDKVYPKINTSEQIDKGVSGGCLFLKMKMRDFIWQTPPDTAQFRALYVGLSQWLYELFDDALTLNDFEERRRMFTNGVIRKSILISNPELEGELILQNKEYEQEAEKYDEYYGNYTKANDKLYELSRSANVPTWDYSKMQEAFPDQYKEVEYWKKLKQISENYRSNKILPLEFRFLHNLAVIDGKEEKSLLTGKDLPQEELQKAKYVDDQYIVNYSSTVRNKLIESVFGEKFYMFIRKQYRTGKEVTYRVYEDAKQYEVFTQEEYDKIYESQIKRKEELITEYKNHIEFLSDPNKTFREKVDYGLANGMGSWYWTSNKRRTFAVMVRRGDIDDAIRLMNSIVNDPKSGYQSKIDEYQSEVDELKEKYKVRENNYAFLEKEEKERKKGERSELVINSGVPLSYIKRVGGVAVYDSDLDTNDKVLSFYKSVLGITRITYGLSLPDKERMAHSKHFAQSIIDLAETLNWDVKALTSLGDLGIMFAASGHGRAMAHFSPTTNAINLTRGQGDGTVSHEMAHYMDFNFARKYPNDGRTEKNHAVFGSYVHSGAKNISNQKIMIAMTSLMDFVVNGAYVNSQNQFDETKIDKEHPVVKQIYTLLPEFVQSVMDSSVTIKIEKNPKKKFNYTEETIEGYIEYLKRAYPQYLNYNYYLQNKSTVVDTLGAILNDLNMDSYDFQFSNKPYTRGSLFNRSKTAFYLKNRAMKSVYWTFYWELFARGFETYIHDKMTKQGRENNYLVSGVYFERPEGVYPYGIERDIFYVLYDNLFNVIKTEMNIPDFTAFRPERVDDYVVLGDNDEEEEAIVVNELTKEVVDGDDELMKEKQIAIQKINRLKELLSKKSEEKFEHGGQINVDENKLVENLFSFSKS